MWLVLLKLFGRSLVATAATIGLYFVEKKTRFGKLPYMARQVIIGVLFGLIAIFGTECGVKIYDADGVLKATANVRDAAPLCAGLVFGAPAGIIAGVIGGVERFFAAYWGRGTYTQWACSISTIIAGVYAGLLRKYLFENKRPSWGFGIATGIVIEVIHLLMVFLTHLSDPVPAINIVNTLALAMIVSNSFSIFCSCLVLQLVNRKGSEKLRYTKISTQVQLWLLLSVAVSYLLSTTVVYAIQTNSAYETAAETFEINLNDIKNDVVNESNNYILSKGTAIVDDIKANMDVTTRTTEAEEFYESLLTKYNVSSVDLIDSTGEFIISSGFRDPTVYDFNMLKGSSAFPASPQSIELHNKINEKKVDGVTFANEYFIQEFQPRSDANRGAYYFKYSAYRFNDDFYIAVGLDELLFGNVIETKVNSMTSYRHVGKTGYVIVFNRNNEIISDEGMVSKYDATTGEYTVPDCGLNPSNFSADKYGKRQRGTVYGEDTFYVYTMSETYYTVVVLPYDEVLWNRDASFILNSFMEVIVFAIIFVLIYTLLKRLVVNKIDSVNNSLGKIISGDLEEKVEVRSSQEFSSLSNDINFTVDTLKKYIEEASARIDEELAFAKSIQYSVLPSRFPAYPNHDEFDIYAKMDTAKEVGGDFYDFYLIDHSHLAITIADVSGKGIPAAMFMMEAKSTLMNNIKRGLPVNEAMLQTNNTLCEGNEENMFVTCWTAVIDLNNGHVCFTNAGHNNPLIYRKGEGWDYLLQRRNLVLASMSDIPYKLQEFDLNPGDRICLYTDGVTEATRGDKVLYGEDRLLDYVNKHCEDNQVDLLKGIKSDIDIFIDGADQFDDITMLVFDYKHPQGE